MTTSMRRPSVAPVLTAVADAPHATGAGVYVTTILNIALLQLAHPDDAPAARTVPVADVRAASGPLIVDGIVFPGLRFGS